MAVFSRENRNTAFAFKVVRIHHALDDILVIAKDVRLPEHRIHERCLAVVHMRDDGDVSYIVSYGHGNSNKLDTDEQG